MSIPSTDDAARDLCLLGQTELWINAILPFVGPNHYVFVAGVSYRMKDLHGQYLAVIEFPRRTSFGAALSSLSCAKYYITKACQHPLHHESQICSRVAQDGSLQVFQWAYKKGYPFNNQTFRKAARSGNFDILKFARANGCP
jgi:hypothetical protein